MTTMLNALLKAGVVSPEQAEQVIKEKQKEEARLDFIRRQEEKRERELKNKLQQRIKEAKREENGK
jgi:hypothetical protein